jgi:uncharacterized C2H2 Zn-finger protein
MNLESLLLIVIPAYIVVVYFFSLLGRKKEIGPRRLFMISLFLTPLMGLAFLVSSQKLKINFYQERNFKCERCGYIFTKEYKYCPFCKKDGVLQELKPVLKQMT